MAKITKEQIDALYEKMAEQYALTPSEGYSYDPWAEIKLEEGGLFQFTVPEEVMLGFNKVDTVTPECARTLGKFQNKQLLDKYCKAVRFTVPIENESNAKKILEGKTAKWPRVYTYVERIVPTSELPASVPLNEDRIDVGFSYETKVPYTELYLPNIFAIRKNGKLSLPLRIRLGGDVKGDVSFQVTEAHYNMRDLLITVGEKSYCLRVQIFDKNLSLPVPTEYRLIEGDESMLDVIIQPKVLNF